MNSLLNFLFAGLFVLILSVAAFLPLSFLRLKGQGSAPLVLGLATTSAPLAVQALTSLPNSLVEVSARAYPNQKTYYNSLFQVRNNSLTARNYKVEVLSVLPADRSLSPEVYFESSERKSEAHLNPNQEVEVSLVLSLSPLVPGTNTPRAYTLKILILPLD